MVTRPFFDSNVLLYSFSVEQGKTKITEQLLKARGVISVQVLNEVAYVARRKLKLSWPEIIEGLAVIHDNCATPVPLTLHTHR